jgi:hypothetical protein
MLKVQKSIKMKSQTKTIFPYHWLAVVLSLAITSTSLQASADTTCTKSSCDLIAKYINPSINILSVLFGLIVVISIILGAIQFITSEGDPQKASRAKDRITNTLLAFFAYVLMYGFLQFLIPGGIFQ